MSDSVWPHRLQPTRLLCPWDSPGKNTGVGCHFPLQCTLSRFSHVQLCVTPWTIAHWAPMGFSRQEYWNGLPVPSPKLTWSCSKEKFRKESRIIEIILWFISEYKSVSLTRECKNPLKLLGKLCVYGFMHKYLGRDSTMTSSFLKNCVQ